MDGKTVGLLARSYANLGQLAEALRCCEIGVAVDKLNPASHYLLATMLQEHGRLDEAVSSLRRALYLDQDFVPAHFALANIARRRGAIQEATKHFQNTQRLLLRYAPEEVLPEFDGMTAGGLKALIESLLETERS
jgi:chemotaxis protein methyltransferase CheR